MRTLLAAGCIAMLCLCARAQTQNLHRDRSAAPAISSQVASPQTRVDINHASVDDLMKVPGMARPWAERIVRFRPYRSKQDLVEHGVVTSEVYDRIKDFVIAHKQKR